MPIPEEILDELGWTVGDDLDYTLDGDSIILRKTDE